MTPIDQRHLERLLTPTEDIQPPADLAARIKAEIPDDLTASTPIRGRFGNASIRRWLPLAAVLTVALGATLLTVRLRDEVDPRADRIVDEATARPSARTTPVPPERPAPASESTSAQAEPPRATEPVLETAPEPTPVAPPRPSKTEDTPQQAPSTDEPPRAVAPPASALEQATTLGRGNLYGQVTDMQGQPLPGVAVELKGSGGRRLAYTNADGRFRTLDLPEGSYQLQSELDGFSTVEYPRVSVRDGRNTSLEVTMSPAVGEPITIIAESPLLDERKIQKGTTISGLDFGKVLAARDPWAAANETARVLSDRVDAGGNESGQQAVLIAPGTTGEADALAVDGVNITDMEAVGSSPTYYDFDEFEGMAPPPPPYVPGAPAAPSTPEQVAEMRASERDRLRSLGYIDRTIRPRPEPPLYDAVTFQDYGTNPFVDTGVDPLSTFGLDVDTGSYNIVRRFLTDGRLPDPAAVRVEELINAFDYRDAPPRRGDFAVHAEAAPSPYGNGPAAYLLRFAIKAREVAGHARPAVDLIFVVDTSGSMARENRLGLVKDALELLLAELRPDDRVGLVTYGSNARIALLPTRDHTEVRACLRGLAASGSTNAAAGLDLGYRLAADYRRPGAISRVLLLSDGVANVGRTDARGILDQVAENAAYGVELTTVGVGMGNFNDVLLEQLADRGDGRYAYVDDLEEARRIFVESLSGTLVTVAAEAKVQVDFDPETVARYRLIGYENREVADRDFRNDSVDAGEIGAGHTAVALYEVELTKDAAQRLSRRRGLGHLRLATLTLRYRSTTSGETVEQAIDLGGPAIARRFDNASPAFQLTALVAEAGEILRHSRYAHGSDLGRVFHQTQGLSARFAGDERVADWVALLGRATRLAGRGWSYED